MCSVFYFLGVCLRGTEKKYLIKKEAEYFSSQTFLMYKISLLEFSNLWDSSYLPYFAKFLSNQDLHRNILQYSSLFEHLQQRHLSSLNIERLVHNLNSMLKCFHSIVNSLPT